MMSRRLVGAGLMRRGHVMTGGTSLLSSDVLRTVDGGVVLRMVGSGSPISAIRGGTPIEEGTPLDFYSDITLEEIQADAHLATFDPPEPPNTTGDVLATTWGNLAAACTANPGRIIEPSGNQPTTGPLSSIEITDATHVMIQIAAGAVGNTLEYGSGCDHVATRGGSATSKLGNARLGGGSQHVTFDSLLMPGTAAGAPFEIASATGPTGLVNCVLGASAPALFNYATLLSGSNNVFFANCNFGSTNVAGKGANNWCIRNGGCDRVVLVDCMVQSTSGQPPVRANDYEGVACHRVTTVHLADGESFADVGGGSPAVVTGFYLHGCTSYVATTSNRFGGLNLSPTDYSGIWRVYDHVWRRGAGNPVSDSNLATAESGERNAGDWEYRLGSPSYTDWDGVHPGWPTITGWHGSPLSTSNPYAL